LRDDRADVRFAIAAYVLLALSTAAAETVTERAKRLFDEGLALKDRGDPRACNKFDESYRLVAASGTGFNLAECMAEAGKYLRAWQLYTAAAREWERNDKDKRVKIARARADELRAKLVKIVVEVEEPTLDRLTLTIGDHRVDPAPVIRELADPGEIEVTASAPGRRPFSKTLRVEPGETATIYVASLAPIAEPVAASGGRRRGRVILAIGLGAVGTGALVTGGVLFLDARQLETDGDHDAAVRRADLATGFGVAGAALVISALVVYATAPRDVAVAPVATAGGAGLAIAGRF
jgi:hypothetical protein